MKTVIEMAREAGFVEDDFYKDLYEGNAQDFERFAALVREDEREQPPNLNCKSVQRRLATIWGYVLPDENNQDLVIAHMVGYEQGKDAGVLAEREACAKVCEELNWRDSSEFAAAIRARGEK